MYLFRGPEHLNNGGFETSTQSWDVAGDKSLSLSQYADPYEGSYCGRVVCSSGYTILNNPVLYQRGFSVEEGMDYLVQLAIKKVQGTIYGAETVSVKLKSWDMNDDWSDYHVVSMTNAYEHHVFALRSSATGSAALVVSLPNFVIDLTNGVVHFDSFEMMRAVDLGAGYGMIHKRHARRNDVKTRHGSLYSYILSGRHHRWEIPVSPIDSAGRCAINSWWASPVESVCWLVDEAVAQNSIWRVNIVNDKAPLETHVTPYGQALWSGKLILETNRAD